MQSGANIFDEIGAALALECDGANFPLLGGRSVDDYVAKLRSAAEVTGWWVCGEFAGFVAFYANDDETKVAFISMLWVSARQRQRKIGSILLRHVAEVCKARAFESIRLQVARDNVAALNFYTGRGFCVVRESAEHLEMRLLVI